MKVLNEINRGGFGRVEKVRLRNGEIVARKIFEPHKDGLSGGDIEKLKQRFKREVRVQSSINNDYILPILESQLSNDPMWFTMPLAEKTFLEQILEDREAGTIPVSALTDILNALEELHNLGFVHRDLKPQNVLFHEKKWKLTDFGLVLPMTSETTKLTSFTTAWGTASYCAPEQIEDFKNATSSVDIYAFGCILHDLFVAQPRVPYQKYEGQGPVGIVIEKCTDIDPKKRFKNITYLRGTLLAILSEPQSLRPSPNASEWAEKIQQDLEWNAELLEDFARFIKKLNNRSDLWVICESLDEEKLKKIYEVDSELWQIIATAYCEWARRGEFGFDYCDVIIGRLATIFTYGNLDVKSTAAISSAVLGSSHHRYYVMRRLTAMCGRSLENRVAQRIAIEIGAEGVHEEFVNCANIVEFDIDVYHPAIANILHNNQ